MSGPVLICQRDGRREAVRGSKEGMNGLDYLEVDGLTLSVYFLRKAPEFIAKENVRIKGGIRTTGIEVKGIDIERQDDPEMDDCLKVTVDKIGDFSTYTLCLVELDDEGRPTGEPLRTFDRRYAGLDFCFHAGASSELDCKRAPSCPPERREEPEPNYLAKDYQSLRQLIRDRLALIMPEWAERHVPDLQITLVELLAYVGDQLSYYQDAVATEAYLETARRRISVRRHARLVDYVLHEGCNARAWVTFQVAGDLAGEQALKPCDFYLITDPGLPGSGNVHDERELPRTLPRPYLVFEPLVEDCRQALDLYTDHNEIKIYTWGDALCCLPKGATSATLLDLGKAPEPDHPPCPCCCCEGEGYVPPERYHKQAPPPPETGHLLKLRRCDVVIFEEVKGPKTGNSADADPLRRHAVRLTDVKYGSDPLNGQLIVDIEWCQEDALPFPLCISSVKQDDCSTVDNVSVARGNVLLVDHGETRRDDLGQVPVISILPECGDPCIEREVTKVAGRYRPRLPWPGVTCSEPLPSCQHASSCYPTPRVTPAASLLEQDVRLALPQVALYGFPAAPDGSPAFTPGELLDPDPLARSLSGKGPSEKTGTRQYFLLGLLSRQLRKLLKNADATQPVPPELRAALVDELKAIRQRWESTPDLVESEATDAHFVVEVDNDSRAYLRFGDGELGRLPDPGAAFQAVYRVGNGPAGNVGAGAISHLVFRNNLPDGVDIVPRNPLPSTGGTAPEPMAEAKLLAPRAFRKDLERAVTADDYAAIVMRDFAPKVQGAAAELNWTGSWHEVRVGIDPFGRKEAEPQLLCEISAHLERYRRIGHEVVVKAATYVPLRVELKVWVLPHYLRGHVKASLLEVFRDLFHPDNLTFGQAIYLSRLIAAAQAVAGVDSVAVTILERLSKGPQQEIEEGLLPIGPLEIARLDNDPKFPDNGRLTLDLRGGR